MPVGATATDWSRVLALRIALVARSNLAERPDATTGLCTTTTVDPLTWTGGTLTISADPNWKCYRYRVFETTVPLRNMIWLQAS
jgi:type IV pilus assembly protein PilW